MGVIVVCQDPAEFGGVEWWGSCGVAGCRSWQLFVWG